MRYYGRKLAFYLVALWGALTLNFLIPRMMPGDPVDILMAKLQQRGGSIDPATWGADYQLDTPRDLLHMLLELADTARAAAA